MAIVCFDLLPQAFMMVGLPWHLRHPLRRAHHISNRRDHHKAGEKREKVREFLEGGDTNRCRYSNTQLPRRACHRFSYMAATKLGMSLAIVIAIHNIPEGIAMATLSIGGMGRARVLLYYTDGPTHGVRRPYRCHAGEISPYSSDGAWGLQGAMLFITCQEIIPQSRNMWKEEFQDLA